MQVDKKKSEGLEKVIGFATQTPTKQTRATRLTHIGIHGMHTVLPI